MVVRIRAGGEPYVLAARTHSFDAYVERLQMGSLLTSIHAYNVGSEPMLVVSIVGLALDR